MSNKRWFPYLSIQSFLVSEPSMLAIHVPDETNESTDSHDHPKNCQTPSPCGLQSYKFTILPVREYWLIYRGLHWRLYDLAPPIPSNPLLPSACCLSFLRVAGRAYWRKSGEGVGEEPNHTTARKPCPLSVIQYSLLPAICKTQFF
jgi:hypothetical protein